MEPGARNAEPGLGRMTPTMGDATAKEKAGIRAAMLRRREAMPGFLRWWRSRAIARRAARLSAAARARTVVAYYPIRGEVDARIIIRQCLARGRRVGLPRTPGGRRLVFESVRGLAGLKPGRFGIPEPAGGERIAPAAVDLAFVPGLAFSRSGQRLGYGGGYYDGFLRGRKFVTVGLCFETQLLAVLPQRRGDVPVDAVVTESRVLVFGSRAL